MRKILLLSIALLSSLFWLSCEESEEGCLDIFSDNYNFHAVSSCDSCCTYPALNLNLKLVYGDVSFRINRDTFPLDGDDSFSISKMEIVFSDFEFVGQQGVYEVLDSLESSDGFIRNDYVFYKTESSQKVGSFRWADTISRVNFKIGFVQDDMESIKPFSELNQNLLLDEALDSLYVDDTSTFLASRINIIMRDSTREITLVDPVENNALGFDVSLPIKAGELFILDCELDLQTLVSGVNSSLTNDEITTLFRVNLPNSLSIE